MGIVVNDGYSNEKEIQLIVNDGTVFFSGTSLFLIRRYGPEIQILLNDAHRNTILTLHRKILSLRRRWEGFAGKGYGTKPIFSVRRSSMIGRSDLIAEVYNNPVAGKFRIERFEKRCFTVYDTRNQSMVAEMRRDGEGFVLRVMPGFDSAFAVALAVVVEQIGAGL